jgi:HD-GYP domain-containing protein (c-di-GMP phosphodiesterase class II)
LTAVFAATLGYSPYDQRLLVQAALLHDIGKTYISLRLLTKPEGLSAKEVQEMRLHPEIGYTALATEGGHDKHMLEVVRHHHERLNGSGYPGGLGWFRQLDLAPFDGLNWPHLEACDLSFRVGLGGRSP